MKFKARAFNPAKHGLPLFAQGKLDGHRISAAWDAGNERMELMTTQFVDITQQCEDYAWFKRLEALVTRKHCRVEFELCCEDGRPAECVKTALKHQQPTTCWPFATNALRDDVPMEDLQEFFEEWALPFPYWLETEDTHTPDWLLDHFREKGYYEGLILKDGNYENWFKLKNTRTIDLVVRGTKDGKKALLGLVGSLECYTTEGHLVANVSGMDMATRVRIDEYAVLGKVVEVTYDRVGNKGKLTRPRFHRWRDDKDADECSVEQDPELQEYWA